MRNWIVPALLLLHVLTVVPGCRSFAEPPPGWKGEFSARHALELALGVPAENSPERSERPEVLDLMASIALVRHDTEPAHRTASILLWKRPGLWSLEQAGPGTEASKFLFDGRRSAELRGGKVVRREVTATEVGVDRLLRHLFLLEYFKDGPGGQAWIEETVPNQEGGYYLRIVKDDESGHRSVLSLDAETFQPVALREWFSSDDDQYRAMDTQFKEVMRDSRGTPVPRLMLSYVNGRLYQELRIRDLAWNRGLRPVDFQVP